MAEDIEKISKKYFPFFMHHFELLGIILSYKLANETCRVEFNIPNLEHILYRMDYNGAVTGFNKKEIIDVMNELRYHVRFTFDRCGLAFTHKGNNT